MFVEAHPEPDVRLDIFLWPWPNAPEFALMVFIIKMYFIHFSPFESRTILCAFMSRSRRRILDILNP